MSGTKDKKKKNRRNDDVYAVFAILGSIVLFSVILMLIGSFGDTSQVTGFGSGGKTPKKDSDSTGIILSCAFVFVLLLGIFIAVKIKDKKKKDQIRAARFEEARRKQELEYARERVKRAKMNDFLTLGEKELERRKAEEARLRQTTRKGSRFDEDGNYIRRDLNDFKENTPAYAEEEKENIFLRILNAIKGFFQRDYEEDDYDEDNEE